MLKKEMADMKTVKWPIAQAAVEAAMVTVLVINEEVRRQSMSTKHGCMAEKNRHRNGPSLRQPFFTWNALDKVNSRNFKMEVTKYIFN